MIKIIEDLSEEYYMIKRSLLGLHCEGDGYIEIDVIYRQRKNDMPSYDIIKDITMSVSFSITSFQDLLKFRYYKILTTEYILIGSVMYENQLIRYALILPSTIVHRQNSIKESHLLDMVKSVIDECNANQSVNLELIKKKIANRFFVNIKDASFKFLKLIGYT